MTIRSIISVSVIAIFITACSSSGSGSGSVPTSDSTAMTVNSDTDNAVDNENANQVKEEYLAFTDDNIILDGIAAEYVALEGLVTLDGKPDAQGNGDIAGKIFLRPTQQIGENQTVKFNIQYLDEDGKFITQAHIKDSFKQDLTAKLRSGDTVNPVTIEFSNAAYPDKYNKIFSKTKKIAVTDFTIE